MTAFPDRIPGRVVRVDRIRYRVATARGTTDAYAGPTDHGSDSGPAVTGDWVGLSVGTDQRAYVAAILPRSSAIKRLDPSTAAARPREQVLVANLDLVFVVHALDRPPQLSRLERTLVMAWESGARPLLVLTKTDLLGTEAVWDTERRVAQIAPGVETISVSNVTGSGLDDLRRLVGPGVTGAFVGESGSGKSTLINNLLDEELQSTGPTRIPDGKGRHTTSSRELAVIPGAGVLIDTPGLRAIGFWGGRTGIAKAFPDIESLTADCQFADCRHDEEPGCAMADALERADLDQRRLDNHRKMVEEVAQLERLLRQRKDRAGPRSRT
jgi:ribosome biogenesis GTPase